MVIENQRRWDGSLGSGEAGLKEVWFKCRRNVERVAEEWTLAGILFRMMLEQMYGMCGLMCCVMARCVRRLVSCQHSDLWRTYQAIARDNMMSNVMWPCVMTWLWYWDMFQLSTPSTHYTFKLTTLGNLSSSSIPWYQPKGSGAMGREVHHADSISTDGS